MSASEASKTCSSKEEPVEGTTNKDSTHIDSSKAAAAYAESSRTSGSQAEATKDDNRASGTQAAAAVASDSDEDDEGPLDNLLSYMKKKLSFSDAEEKKTSILESLDVAGIVKHINSGKCSKIITMAGAGISTSAGIPDFRSPESGLYNNLQKYDLPYPEAIFQLDYFAKKPQPFFTLAKELYPGSFDPTPCHYFIKLLETKGLLLRHFTQNIDTLEHVAGISDDKLVEAHGTFRTAHCIGCSKLYTQDWVKEEVFADRVPSCTECNGIVKPDIVFFGEGLPDKFFKHMRQDFPSCDLLIIMGTSLTVQPFASLIEQVPKSCPRLLVNREAVGGSDSMMTTIQQLMGKGGGLMVNSSHNTRDVAMLGDCDQACLELAEKLGWKEELADLIASNKKKDNKTQQSSP